jgi:hypothetical protein
VVLALVGAAAAGEHEDLGVRESPPLPAEGGARFAERAGDGVGSATTATGQSAPTRPLKATHRGRARPIASANVSTSKGSGGANRSTTSIRPMP